MKKGTIILLISVLFPLLCSAAQQRTVGSDTLLMEDCLCEKDCTRLPLSQEDGREYSDTDMWCLLQAISATDCSAKWQGGTSGKHPAHSTHTPSMGTLANNSPHLPFPMDVRCVFIQLHHLII